jgi:hypothetical protein
MRGPIDADIAAAAADSELSCFSSLLPPASD